MNTIQVHALTTVYGNEKVNCPMNIWKRLSERYLKIAVIGDLNAKVGSGAYRQWADSVSCFGLSELNK